MTVIKYFCLLSLLFMCSGCFMLVAGAGAGGAVLWQNGKVVSQETTSREAAASAVLRVFQEKNIRLTSQVVKNEVTQLRGEDTTGKNVAVDIFAVGNDNVRLEVRSGLNDKNAAQELYNQIKKRL